MKRWFPDTVQGQIVVILVGALLATLVFVAVVLDLLRPEVPPMPPGPWPGALRVAMAAKALHAAPPDARPTIGTALSDEEMRILVGAPAPCSEIPETLHSRGQRLVLDILLADRPEPFVHRNCAAPSGMLITQVEFPSDAITVNMRINVHEGFAQNIIVVLPLAVGGGFLLILLVVLSLWTLWRVNQPLRRIARTVERFGVDAAVAPLPETGLREFRRLAQAFNRMQRRIAQLVTERSQMLMAVSHDLRTPLTRLKLRIELDDEQAPRHVLLRELDLMHRMIDGALSFLNDRQSKEAFEEVDLGALVESICIEFADSGKSVAYVGAYGLICPCQPTGLTRAVNNLVENACRYGRHVSADVRRDDGHAVIEIQDDGPGIPAGMRDAVLEPFARLDSARASDGGLGLGLSIVRDVVRRHDARLFLLDAEPHGLLVRILLPITPQP
ncbi:ATP-binding protein [Telmatospirillum siberiense]|uniref:histidine kinase n=1 Tax=Telmatospirillum siberiense TaxID=382514 RepID=A0A2N3PYG0_9PROT|nr:ATP-binding protein [Telmatospirillum siberiense]PKU25447.1 histidine kinase [Telmatospirillum siberiense]